VERGLLLDVVIRQRAPVLQLLACEDQALLIGRDPLLVLDLGLHVVNGVAGLHVERDRLTREGLHENLHTAAETKHEVERRFLLDVVIAQRPPVLELLPSEDQALLVGRNPFLVLDLGLHVVDGVARLHVERDRLTREGLHEDLHSAAETKHEVERGLLLDVVIAQRPPVLELLPGEDQALLVGRNPLLVLDLGLHVVDGVTRLDI